MKKIIFSLVIFLSFFISFTTIQPVFAAGATIALSPQSGSYGKPFKVNLIVNGNGDKFNAAQATVSISSNFKIQDLELGDCNFSFLKTPTVQDPSFAGIIISTYSTKCTAYTLTLVPIQKGKAIITLSKGSIKRYGDAHEIFSSAVNGTYIVTGVAKDTAPLGTEAKNTSQNGLYTLYLKVIASNNPVQNATVILNAVSKENNQQAPTDNTGTAHFSNLKSGVYDATVKQGFNKVGETIVNVSGANHILSLTINLDAQKNNPLMKAGSFLASLTANPFILAGFLVLGIIIGVGIALLVIKLIGKRKGSKD
jgi:hypothetical protein